MNEPASAQHAHSHPEDEESEGEWDEYSNKKRYFLAIFICTTVAVLALCVTALCGGWSIKDVEEPNPALGAAVPAIENVTARPEYDLWGQCFCYATTAEPCSKLSELYRGGQIITAHAWGAEAALVVLLALRYSGFFRAWQRFVSVVGCVLGFVASACLLVTFSVFSASFSRMWCGEAVRKRGAVSWAFAFRIVEFVLSVILLCAQVVLTKKRSKRFGKTLLWCAVGLLFLTTLTSVTRGWVKDTSRGYEVGMWRGCVCPDNNCNSETAHLQGIQCVHTFAAVMLFAFETTFFLHISKKAQVALLTGCLLGTLLSIILYSIHHTKGFCNHESAKDMGYHLAWPLFTVVGSAALQVAVLVCVILRWLGFLY